MRLTVLTLCAVNTSLSVPLGDSSSIPVAMFASPADVPDTVNSVDGVSDSSEINTTRLAIIGGTLAVGVTTIHVYQANGWWKYNAAAFHFQEDLTYGLWVDKLGHFYAANVLTFMFSRSLQWANFSERSSLWWGFAGSALFQTYVEVEDGFHTWGFDRVDFAFDIAGAFYPLVQHYVPALQDFNFKFSYHPSDLLNNPGGVGFRGQKHLMMDDYEGQTIWLSFRMNNILPSSVEPYWPDWLCLAVGYGARDVATPDPYPVVFLALDYDVSRIIPDHTSFLKLLGEALNFIHFPAPAVRITPSAIWYGFYF